MQDPITSLMYINAILKNNNIRKAAKELYISQPSLTQYITRIENDIGAKIINRTKTPYTLTQAGVIYHNYIENIIAANDNLKKDLAQYSSFNKNTIRIGIAKQLSTFLLPKLFSEFCTNNPKLEIKFIEDSAEGLTDKLLNEQIHCFIGQPDKTSSYKVKYESNKSGTFFAIIPQKSKFYNSDKTILNSSDLNLKELISQPLILSTPYSSIRYQIDELFHKFDVKPRIIFESDNISTVTNLALHGHGITISTPIIINSLYHPSNNVNFYPIKDKSLQPEYFIAILKKKKISSQLRKIINQFKELEIDPNISL